MNTDDKFHPVNCLERAQDRDEAFDRDDVLTLIQEFRRLEAAAEDERDELEDRLAETQRALRTFQAIAVESAKERLGA